MLFGLRDLCNARNRNWLQLAGLSKGVAVVQRCRTPQKVGTEGSVSGSQRSRKSAGSSPPSALFLVAALPCTLAGHRLQQGSRLAPPPLSPVCFGAATALAGAPVLGHLTAPPVL